MHVSLHVISSFHSASVVPLSLSVPPPLWPVFFSFHLGHVVPLPAEASLLLWPVSFWFLHVPVSLLVLFSYHLTDIVHSTAPFYAHGLLFLWPSGPNHFALQHLQLRPFSSHSFCALCSTQQFSVCVPHDFCPQQTSLELAQMEVHRMAPMLIFCAEPTHALWTYSCGAEREAPQTDAYAFYFHSVCDVPVHQE